MEHLIERFHSLKGDSISDHKRSFNAFIKDLETTQEEQLTQLLTNIIPKTRQEENFRVLLFIKYGTSDHILKLLMEGDRVSTRILLNKAKINNLFSDICAEHFTSVICPQLSFVTRVRLIYKLSFVLSTIKGKEYYAAVYKKYGFRIASPLLIACDEDFIVKTMSQHKITFTDRQLIKLYKFKTVLLTYFKHKRNFHDYNLLGRYLAVNAIDTFNELLQYGEPSIGKNCAKRYIKKYKHELISKFTNYRFIKAKYVMACWNREEYNLYLQRLLPKNVDEFRFDNNLARAFKALPKYERYPTLRKTFKDVYGCEILPGNCHLRTKIFGLAQQREWKQDIEEYNISLIKEKINITSDMRSRTDLLIKMLETCRLYEDLPGLLDVLRYFSTRHKNEDSKLKMKFMEALSSKFEVQHFGDEFWEIINELMKRLEFDGESTTNFLIARIHNKLIKNMDVTEDLKTYLKTNRHLRSWNILRNSPEYQKMCMMRCFEIYDKVFENDKEKKKVTLIASIEEWNSQHPRDLISYYKYPDCIRAYFKMKQERETLYHWESSIIKKILLFKPRADEEKINRDNILKTYLDNYPKTFNDDMHLWFLRNQPSFLQRHIDLVKYPDYNFYYEVNKMRYHPIHEVCKQRALQEARSTIKFFTFDDTFWSIVEKYKPKTGDIDVNQTGIKNLVELQIEVLQNIKHRSKPEECLNIIMTFCQKDYLRYALEALYHSLFHSRESSITQTIMEIMNRAVSVRKHAIFLSSTLLSWELAVEILTKFLQTEKNRSVRQFILKRTFQTLLHEGSQEYWNLLKMQLLVLEPDDEEMMSMLTDINGIPENYIGEYIQLIWDYLKKCKENKAPGMLHQIKRNTINLVSNEFCKAAIEETIFNENQFLYYYLLSDHENLSARIVFIFNIISARAPSPHKMYIFIEYICNTIIHDRPTIAIELIKLFKHHLTNLQLGFNDIEMELLIEATSLYLQMPETDYEGLVKLIIQLQTNLIDKFGSDILDFFKVFAASFLDMVFWKFPGENRENYLELVEKMILLNSSDRIRLLALNLLPKWNGFDLTYKTRRKAVLDIMTKNASPVLNVYLMRFSRQL